VNNCITCRTEHHHIFFQFLSVHGLTTIFLVSGLGVQDQQKSPVLFYVVYSRGAGPQTKFSYENQEDSVNWNDIFETLLPLVTVNPYGTALSLSSRSQNCVQNCGV
jgi:hypothetical protein